jgi:hypothetical protein
LSTREDGNANDGNINRANDAGAFLPWQTERTALGCTVKLLSITKLQIVSCVCVCVYISANFNVLYHLVHFLNLKANLSLSMSSFWALIYNGLWSFQFEPSGQLLHNRIKLLPG